MNLHMFSFIYNIFKVADCYRACCGEQEALSAQFKPVASTFGTFIGNLCEIYRNRESKERHERLGKSGGGALPWEEITMQAERMIQRFTSNILDVQHPCRLLEIPGPCSKWR